MNSNLLIFFTGAIWAFVVGLVGYQIYHARIIQKAEERIARRRREFPSLNKKSEIKTEPCENHSWNLIYLVFPEVEKRTHSVCTECGLVAGTDYYLNKAGMEVYKNEIERRRENSIKANKEEHRKLEALQGIVQVYKHLFTGVAEKDMMTLYNFFNDATVAMKPLDDGTDG